MVRLNVDVNTLADRPVLRIRADKVNEARFSGLSRATPPKGSNRASRWRSCSTRMTCCVDGKPTYSYMPTVGRVREFPPLRVGDAVQVDILKNISTGEKIYDVLKVSGERPPVFAPPAPPRPRFSMRDIRVDIAGKTVVQQHGLWMRGGGLVIHLPGHGEFYITLPPAPDGVSFLPSGWIDHAIMRFHAASDLVEITSGTNILENADFATVWIYHVPGSSEAERLRERLVEARKLYTDKHPDVLALKSQLAAIDRGIEFTCMDDLDFLKKK